MTEKSPREECYHAIRNAFSSGIAGYYKKHPHRLSDPMLETGIKALMALMMDILKILDRYELKPRTRHERKTDQGSGNGRAQLRAPGPEESDSADEGG
jgi:hypothetical protein